jgi:uracil-DNA glycosylase family protein
MLQVGIVWEEPTASPWHLCLTMTNTAMAARPVEERSTLARNARDLAGLRKEAATCRACPLWRHATQTVFGEGPAHAALMLVGEQPGDQEDRAGHPFVGPAGTLLRRALASALIDVAQVYLTNGVKHFKHLTRGKRRLHQRPNAGEIEVCRWWLTNEIAIVRPKLIVALGATAIRAIVGAPVPVGKNRGRILDRPTPVPVFVTVHPSSLLRLVNAQERRTAFQQFIRDLAAAKKLTQADD